MLFYEQNDEAAAQLELALEDEKTEEQSQEGVEALETPEEYGSDTESASDPGIGMESTASSTDPWSSTTAPSFSSSTGFTLETPSSTPPSSVVESECDAGMRDSVRDDDANKIREPSSHLPSPPNSEVNGSY
jgi:hypothetical protein